MEKRDLLYEGKAKKVFATDDPALCVVSYKDDATAFNGKKKGSIEGKGAVNNKLTNLFMALLERHGTPTHFVRQLGDTDALVKKVSIIPLEVIVRNVAAGSLSARLGIAEGTRLAAPVLEFCYKNDDLGDPMVNEYHIAALGAATRDDLAALTEMAFRINGELTPFLKELGIDLIDFKLEFGKTPGGEIILADEISPDTCRFWDAATGEKLDKDRFRRDMGGVEDAYREMLKRLTAGREGGDGGNNGQA